MKIRALLLVSMLTFLACRTVPLKAPDLDAAAVLDRHVAATGGPEAYAHNFRISKGTVLYKSLNTLCNLTVHETRSTDRRWFSRSEATGDQEEGSFEEVAWSYALMSGVLLPEGEDLDQALRDAPIDAAVRWREQFESVKLLPDRILDSRAVHAVELTPASGTSEVRFFDVETGLHVRTEGRRIYYGNLLPVVFTYGDYRSVDGVLLSHSIRRAYASIEELIIELHEVDHVENLPPTTFDPPAEVAALLRQ